MGPIHIFGLFWIIHMFTYQVYGSGSFQLRLNQFTNQYGLATDDTCCRGVKSKSGYCTSPCNTFFRICLKEYQAHISTDSTKCTFGEITTPALGDNSFKFEDTSSTFQNPVRFDFEFSWPGTYSLIVEAWHAVEDVKKGSPRELIYQSATQGSIQVGQQWKNETYNDRSKYLSFSYRVVCAENYYGSGCADLCKARDDNYGHYRCNKDGSKTCMEGWTGNYCDRAICLPGCHNRHGTCSKPNECKCNLGWQGKYCDQCIPYPGCQHGTCQIRWECKCNEGWGGLFCNQDLNFCTHHEPCKNGGSCTNTGQGSYTCECPPGFSGTNCELQINDCLHQPCKNGGSCTASLTGSGYYCQCPKGFSGPQCQSSYTSCSQNPCQHGSTCTTLTGVQTYKCDCIEGYTGVNCEIEEYDCNPNPCENGGRCVDERNGYRCVCEPGYGGEKCQQNINDCQINPCLNGATCKDEINAFKCQCLPGFSGDFCEENVDDCKLFPCANGGTCHDLVNDFICDCAPGFGERDCSGNINECDAHPCQHGANCVDLINDYKCECINGYHGKNCETPKGQTGYPAVNRTSTTSSTTPTIIENITEDFLGSGGLSQPRVVQDQSILSLQLVLYICLGVGIPCFIIIVILVIFLVVKRMRNRDQDSDSVQTDNERNEKANMNNTVNKNKSIENDITSVPPNSVSLKITNEEQSSSRTLNINHNNLNIDKNTVKIFPKELNTHMSKSKDHRHLNTRDLKDNSSHSSKILDCNKLVSQQQGCSQVLSSLESPPGVTEISDQPYPGDVHVVKPSNKDLRTSSIYYVENHPHTQYAEGVLATEV